MAAVARLEQLGVTPLGCFLDYQVADVPPGIMSVGPVPTVKTLLAKNNLRCTASGSWGFRWTR